MMNGRETLFPSGSSSLTITTMVSSVAVFPTRHFPNNPQALTYILTN
jgi:hypothetical protein